MYPPILWAGTKTAKSSFVTRARTKSSAGGVDRVRRSRKKRKTSQTKKYKKKGIAVVDNPPVDCVDIPLYTRGTFFLCLPTREHFIFASPQGNILSLPPHKEVFFLYFPTGKSFSSPPLCKGRWLAAGKTEGLLSKIKQNYSLWTNKARIAFKTARIITPTSAKIASHILAMPMAPNARQINFTPMAKTIF